MNKKTIPYLQEKFAWNEDKKSGKKRAVRLQRQLQKKRK
jgi:hypothetical protein